MIEAEAARGSGTDFMASLRLAGGLCGWRDRNVPLRTNSPLSYWQNYYYYDLPAAAVQQHPLGISSQSLTGTESVVYLVDFLLNHNPRLATPLQSIISIWLESVVINRDWPEETTKNRCGHSGSGFILLSERDDGDDGFCICSDTQS